MYLGGVAHDGGSTRTQALLDNDVSRQLGSEQSERFSHDLLDMHGDALADSAAAEREDAFDQRIGALAGDDDVFDIVAQPTAGADFAKRHLSVTQYRAEEIVEVVRDAARERAECFETLSLTQLTLDSLQFLLGNVAIRDIEHETDHSRGVTFGVEEHSPFCLKPAYRAVAVNHPIFSVDIAGLLCNLHGGLDVRPVLGV